MAVEVTMPQLSDTMSEGKILTWLVNEGDSVSRGDALAEVATDKADLEIECFHDGTVLKIHAPVGTTVQVGSVIAHIGEQGETVPDVSASQPAPAAAPEAPAAEAQPAPATPPAPETSPPPTAASNGGDERIKISPLAKNIAASHSVDYAALKGKGSGEGGRIVKKDVEALIGSSPAQPSPAAAAVTPRPAPAAAPPAQGPATTAPLSTMRQTIAARMVQSVNEIPHFYLTSKIAMDDVVQMRKTLKTHPHYEGITFNHLIIKAAALALRAIPRINASYQDGQLVQPQNINIGIVTAVDDGLMMPVLKNADHLPLADIVQEGRGLIDRARAGRPKSDDLTGGTFSISNVGNLAIESFTAIISPGQGAILAIGSLDDEPTIIDGELSVSTVMRATLSVDHRIIDGVVGAQFLTEFKRLLEEPVLLLA